VSPFRAKDRNTWKVRVVDCDGGSRTCGTGTESKKRADAMERWVKELRRGADRRPDVLAAIVRGSVPLARAYDQRADLDALMESASEVDLEPHVVRWNAELMRGRKGAASASRYLAQVRRLIPAGKRYPSSRFTTVALYQHLVGLEVDDPTRNRHKAALSSFAKYLVRHGILDRNPVREVEGWSAGAPRIVYHERPSAQAIIAALPQPYAALEAIMCGAGHEWQAITRLRVRDVQLEADIIEADGGKTDWRKRTAQIVEPWTKPYIAPALEGKEPDDLVFPGINHKRALAEHRKAVATAKAKASVLHDWRHTIAVQMLRDGYLPTVVAHQLGHRDAILVWTVYGRFVVTKQDYKRRVGGAPVPPESATPSATPPGNDIT
jgi:integrase